ncbi:MAG: hypothetical protein ACI89E_001060, partial [Planctomycetota bacterium]
ARRKLRALFVEVVSAVKQALDQEFYTGKPRTTARTQSRASRNQSCQA